MEFPLSPQEVGALKARLAADARDEGARRELVAWYRRTQHLDQAGRYAIAVDGFATEPELRAYGALLRGLRADDRRMAVLSRLPDDADSLMQARKSLDDVLVPARDDFIDAVAPVIWSIFTLAVLAALVWTFVAALLNGDGAHFWARVLSVVCLGILALACGISSVDCARDRSRVAAVVFGLLAAAAVASALLLLR